METATICGIMISHEPHPNARSNRLNIDPDITRSHRDHFFSHVILDPCGKW